MWRPVLLLGLGGVWVPGARGQGVGDISGRVTSVVVDAAGDPVPGVAIRIPAVGRVVLTGSRGEFVLSGVPAGRHEVTADLVGCLLGRQWVELRPGEGPSVEFVVREPAIRLPGIVVRREDDQRLEALSVSRMEVDGRRAGRTLADLIRGEFPGVRVVQGSGLPGTEGAIQLRGPRSLSSGGQPLVVVDGAVATGGSIDLNMEHVESVTILKGAAAAAEYGSRGQAGVIEVTTRRGGREGGGAPGPLVVVDGALSGGGLAAVDPAAIRASQLLVGPAAAALVGTAGVAGGVFGVTTASGSPAGGEGARCTEVLP